MLLKVGEIAELQKGFHFKSQDYVSSGRKIIRVTNLNKNDYSDDNCLYIAESKYHEYEKYSLKTSDIVISTVGSWPNNPLSVVGKVTVIPESIEGSLLNQNAVRIRAKECCLQEYLIYKLISEDFKKYIIGKAQGSASQASIKLDDIKSYQVEVPSIEKQKKMTDILKTIDQKIYLNCMINERLRELRDILIPQIMNDELDISDIFV